MPTLWTIGHSTRELDDFLALLTENKIESLADVRRFPGSRRHPHFNREALSASLENVGITYTHFPALGGRRKSSSLPLPQGEGRGDGASNVPNSTQPNNSAWRVAASA